MAGTLKTSNYELAKYAPGDVTSWLTDFNGNMDKIDAGMQANKQAAEQAQDDVDNLESEYESLLQTVNGHTTSIQANEKAIAANTASISEMGDEINDIRIGQLVYLDSGFTLRDANVMENVNSVSIQVVGNGILAEFNFNTKEGTTHTYDAVINDESSFNGYNFTNLFSVVGNPFNLTANKYYYHGAIGHWDAGGNVTAVGQYMMGVKYDSSANVTMFGFVNKDTSGSPHKKMYVLP